MSNVHLHISIFHPNTHSNPSTDLPFFFQHSLVPLLARTHIDHNPRTLAFELALIRIDHIHISSRIDRIHISSRIDSIHVGSRSY